MALPPSYQPASWRGLIGVRTELVGLSFDTPAGVVRLSMPAGDLREMARRILFETDSANWAAVDAQVRALIHSESSSGSPSNEGSPQDGQAQ